MKPTEYLDLLCVHYLLIMKILLISQIVLLNLLQVLNVKLIFLDQKYLTCPIIDGIVHTQVLGKLFYEKNIFSIFLISYHLSLISFFCSYGKCRYNLSANLWGRPKLCYYKQYST